MTLGWFFFCHHLFFVWSGNHYNSLFLYSLVLSQVVKTDFPTSPAPPFIPSLGFSPSMYLCLSQDTTPLVLNIMVIQLPIHCWVAHNSVSPVFMVSLGHSVIPSLSLFRSTSQGTRHSVCTQWAQVLPLLYSLNSWEEGNFWKLLGKKLFTLPVQYTESDFILGWLVIFLAGITQCRWWEWGAEGKEREHHRIMTWVLRLDFI